MVGIGCEEEATEVNEEKRDEVVEEWSEASLLYGPPHFARRNITFEKKKLNFPLPADLLPRLYFSSFMRSLSLIPPRHQPPSLSRMDPSRHLTYGASKTMPVSIFNWLGPSHNPRISRSHIALSLEIQLSLLTRVLVSEPSSNYQIPRTYFRTILPLCISHGAIYIYRLVVFRSTPFALRASHWKIDNHVFRVTFFSLIFFLLSGLQCAQFPSFPPLIPHPNWYACIPFDLNFLFAVFGLFTSNSYACVDTLFRLFGYK